MLVFRNDYPEGSDRAGGDQRAQGLVENLRVKTRRPQGAAGDLRLHQAWKLIDNLSGHDQPFVQSST